MQCAQHSILFFQSGSKIKNTPGRARGILILENDGGRTTGIKGILSDGMVTRSILLQIDDSQLGTESWFRSKIQILFLRAYAWNDEIFFCLLRFTNNVWTSSRRGAGSHRSVEESIKWPSHLRVFPWCVAALCVRRKLPSSLICAGLGIPIRRLMRQ